ncbi:MAG: hypothetical protein WKF33_12205 [Thermoleophilaceae bacterium]
MTALVLDPGQATLWWIALAVGAVVVGVVIALLTLLSRLLTGVGSSVAALEEVAGRIDGAAPGDDLPAAAASLRELGTEIKLQDELLGQWTQRSR